MRRVGKQSPSNTRSFSRSRGQKEDDQPFIAVFGQLEGDPSFAVPNCMIELYPPVGAVPKGIDWLEVAKKVADWFNSVRERLPEGASEHVITGLPFPLRVDAQKTAMDGYPGRVFVDRPLPRDKKFVDVVRRALRQKLPKLAETLADMRLLLLEKGTTARGYAEVGRTIDSVRREFPALEKVDEVWVSNTVAMGSEGVVLFARVWPGRLGKRFWVHCLRNEKGTHGADR